MFPQIFESFYRSFFGPRPSMGDHGGRREKTGDGAALCQGDEHNGGSKRVFVPCSRAPNCKSVGPSGVGPCLHFSCIAPSLNPPSTHPPLPYQLTTLSTLMGACSSMPPVRATTESEVQRSHFRPAQLCWVWPCQDYCLEPRQRKLSRTCVGLAKRSPAAPGRPMDRAFPRSDGLPHGQSLVLLSHG